MNATAKGDTMNAQALALAEMKRVQEEKGRPLFDSEILRIQRAFGIDGMSKVACF